MMATFPTFSIAEGKPDLAPKSPGEGASAQGSFLSLLSSLGAPGDEASSEAAGPAPAAMASFALAAAMPKAALSVSGEGEGEDPAKDSADEADGQESPDSSGAPWAAMLGLPGLFVPDGAATPRVAGTDPTPQAPTGAPGMLLSTTMPAPGTSLPVEGSGSDAMPAPAPAAGAEAAAAPDAQSAMAKPGIVLPADLLKTVLTAHPGGAAASRKGAQAPVDAAPKLDVAIADTLRPLTDMPTAFAPTTIRPVDQPTSSALPTGTDMAGQMVEHQLDLAHESRWLDQLAKDIARAGSADGHLRFRLNPENLGNLHVEMSNGHAGASVRLIADTEAARALLADAQPRLVAEARAQGVRIAETHVDLGQGGHGHGHSMADQQREQRGMQGEAYLTTFKPKQADGAGAPPTARHAAERYA